MRTAGTAEYPVVAAIFVIGLLDESVASRRVCRPVPLNSRPELLGPTNYVNSLYKWYKAVTRKPIKFARFDQTVIITLTD